MSCPPSQPCARKCGVAAYVVGVAGTFLVMAWMVWLMKANSQNNGPSQNRVAERIKIKSDFQAANAPLLDSYAWQDPTHDVVRVPVEQAKYLFLTEWQQDPAAGRALLTNRAAKAFAPVAPPKNPYE